MKKEEDLPSSQLLSEEKDVPINERASEELSFNDGRVDVYLNVRLNTNKFVINCKDDEEEREKPFPSENKEDFTVSFSTTRQRCLIPTSGEGKRYAFHCRSTDDVPKFILTNLPPCCISVKDKCPCSNSSSKDYYMTASDDDLLCLKEGAPPEGSRTACWQFYEAPRSRADLVIGRYNQDNTDTQYITVESSRLKLTYDGQLIKATPFRQCETTKNGVYFQYKSDSREGSISLGEKQDDETYSLVLSAADTAIISFTKRSCFGTGEKSVYYFICEIPKGVGPCSKGNAMEGDSTDVFSTEGDRIVPSEHRLSLCGENGAKEAGGIVVLPKDGMSGHPSEPSQESQPPDDRTSCA
jgi:hypothetical protein